MANLEGMKMKFTVVKNSDVQEFLQPTEKEWLDALLEAIEIRKETKLTRTANREAGTDLFYNPTPKKYLVINSDEIYADEVIEILKRHGHWG